MHLRQSNGERMTSTQWRWARTAACVASALCVLAGVTTGSAQAAPTGVVLPAAASATPKSEWCARPMSRLELFRGTSRFDPPSTLTLLGATRKINLNTFTIQKNPYSDVSQTLWYRSLLWLAVATVNASEAGNSAAAQAMAAQALRAAEAFPDPAPPGKPGTTPWSVAVANSIGWDEGTAFRRTEALLCLSAFITPKHPMWPRLRSLLLMHAQALVDSARYKGPPRTAVHNHGMLANLVLIDVARRLTLPIYRQVAINRLVHDSDQVFSPQGWSYEGSSLYQSVNIRGWQDVARELRSRGLSSDAVAIEQRLARAIEMVAQFRGPTNLTAAIGNARMNDAVIPAPLNPSRPLSVLDPDAGVAAGRWSWTDTSTTWWTALNRPVTGAHGHDDNMSVTWQTLGFPVVVDIGQYDYDHTGLITRWTESAVAHNRAIPANQSRNELRVRGMSVTRTGSLDTINITSSDKGPVQEREILVDDARRSMQVTDSSARRLTQYWHLGPDWKVSSQSRTSATLRGPAGRILRVTTSPGANVNVAPTSLIPPAGLFITGYKAAVGAPELRITGDSSISTTFQALRRAKAGTPLPNLTVSAQPRSRKASVSWQWAGAKKGTRKVKGYRVQLHHPDQGWRTVIADTGSAKQSLGSVGRLTNGLRYLVRVAPLTRSGIGEYSEPADFTPVSVPGRPLSPVVAGRQLSWTAPNDGGYRIKEYLVTVAGEEPITTRRPSVRLPGLPAGRAVVSIQGRNKLGTGRKLMVTVNVAGDGGLTLL